MYKRGQGPFCSAHIAILWIIGSLFHNNFVQNCVSASLILRLANNKSLNNLTCSSAFCLLIGGIFGLLTITNPSFSVLFSLLQLLLLLYVLSKCNTKVWSPLSVVLTASDM